MDTFLYAFVTPKIEAAFRQLVRKHHVNAWWPKNDLGAWMHDIDGQPCSINGMGICYLGFIGSGRYRLPDIRSDDVAAELRVKHPNWSSAKIDRAARESAASRSVRCWIHPARQIECDRYIAKMIAFFTDVANEGSFSLIQMPAPEHKERIHAVQRWTTAELIADRLLTFPLNTLVRISRD